MEQRWTPRDGYGLACEPLPHPMLAVEDGKTRVDYDYKGEDAVKVARNVMPLPEIMLKLFEDEAFKKNVAFLSGTVGMVLFEVECPLMFRLFYSNVAGIEATMDTYTLCRYYRQIMYAAQLQFKNATDQNKENYRKIVSAYEFEEEFLFEELLRTLFNQSKFQIQPQNDLHCNAMIEIFIPFTLSRLALMERHLWRLFSSFSLREHAVRISTKMLPSICNNPTQASYPNQGEACIRWYVGMKKEWEMLFRGKIEMKNTFKLTDEKFQNSRYYLGVNVKQALALYDIFRQKNEIVVVEKKDEVKK